MALYRTSEEDLAKVKDPYMRKRLEQMNSALDNQEAKKADRRRRGLKPKKKSMKSAVQQHQERLAKMDKKNIPAHRRNYAIPAVLLIQFLKGGFSQADIARLLEISPRAVSRAIQKHHLDPKLISAWGDHKVDVLAAKEMELIEAMNEEKIDKATLRDCATSFKMLHEAGRHEKGLGGTEVNVNVITASLSDLDKQEAKLMEQLRELSGGKIGGAIEDATVVEEDESVPDISVP